MKIFLLPIFILAFSVSFSQNVGVGTTTPSHYFHIVPPVGVGDPIRIEGLQSFGSETDVLVVDPASGVIRVMPFQQLLDMDSIYFNDSSYSLLTDSMLSDTIFLDSLMALVNIDNQNIDSITLNGTMINIFIEDGSSASLDLQPIIDSAIANSPTGSDDQNIDSLRLNGTLLTTYIESGTAANIDLQPIVDSALANVPPSSDDQNIDSVTLNGNVLEVYIENGTSANVDLSTFNNTGTDDQNVDSIRLNGTNLTVYIENGASANIDLQPIVDSAIANNPTGSDDQNIDSLRLNGTLLTTYIESGTAANIDLQPIIDSALANVPPSSDDQNIDSVTLNGNILEVYIENGTSANVDLSTFNNPGTDDQDVDSIRLNGTDLTVYIENGASANIDLQPIVDSAIANSPAGSDNQNIDSLRLNGTLLTTYIESGTAANIDLQPIVDSALANVPPSSDDQNIDSVTLNGNILEVHIENGASATQDLSGLLDSSEWIEGNKVGLNPSYIYARRALTNGDTTLVSVNGNIAIGKNNDTIYNRYDGIDYAIPYSFSSSGAIQTSGHNIIENNGGIPNLVLIRSQGSSDNRLPVNDGDWLGSILFGGYQNNLGYTGGENPQPSLILANATVGTSDYIGGNLIFKTRDTGQNLSVTAIKIDHKQMVKIGTGNPTNKMHISDFSNDPIRIEGLQMQNIISDSILGIDASGIVKLFHKDSILSGIGTTGDDQNIDSLRLNGTVLTTFIESGSSASLDLQPIVDSAIANSPAGSDNQNIDSLRLNGTVLTTFIESGSSASLDLQPIVDSALANSGDSDWDISGTGGLEGGPGTNTASGNNAIAAGNLNLAAGNGSIALGYNDTVFGDGGVVLGYDNHASGFVYATIGGGNLNTASGFIASTVAGGQSNTASSSRATVSGGGANTASEQNATVGGGYHDTASGVYSTVSGGNHNKATDTAATISGGRLNTASGTYSTVSGGLENTAYSYGEWAGGLYATNYAPSSTSSWIGTDRLFVVGNGTSSATRSNALTLYKDGSLEINEAYTLPNSDGSANEVLTTDGAGNVSWTDIANGSVKGTSLTGFGGCPCQNTIDSLYSAPVIPFTDGDGTDVDLDSATLKTWLNADLCYIPLTISPLLYSSVSDLDIELPVPTPYAGKTFKLFIDCRSSANIGMTGLAGDKINVYTIIPPGIYVHRNTKTIPDAGPNHYRTLFSTPFLSAKAKSGGGIISQGDLNYTQVICLTAFDNGWAISDEGVIWEN